VYLGAIEPFSAEFRATEHLQLGVEVGCRARKVLRRRKITVIIIKLRKKQPVNWRSNASFAGSALSLNAAFCPSIASKLAAFFGKTENK